MEARGTGPWRRVLQRMHGFKPTRRRSLCCRSAPGSDEVCRLVSVVRQVMAPAESPRKRASVKSLRLLRTGGGGCMALRHLQLERCFCGPRAGGRCMHTYLARSQLLLCRRQKGNTGSLLFEKLRRSSHSPQIRMGTRENQSSVRPMPCGCMWPPGGRCLCRWKTPWRWRLGPPKL